MQKCLTGLGKNAVTHYGLITKHVQLSRAKAIHRVNYPVIDHLHHFWSDQKHAGISDLRQHGDD